MKKGLKVVNNSTKSPYLNNVFTKGGVNQQSTNSQVTATDTSSQSSAKANRKGAASAEISDSSLNVLKKISRGTAQGAIKTINSSSVKPVNAKLLAAIQRVHKGGSGPGTSIVTKQSTSQQSAMSTAAVESSVVSQVGHMTSTPGSLSQQHKKNSKS